MISLLCIQREITGRWGSSCRFFFFFAPLLPLCVFFEGVSLVYIFGFPALKSTPQVQIWTLRVIMKNSWACRKLSRSGIVSDELRPVYVSCKLPYILP